MLHYSLFFFWSLRSCAVLVLADTLVSRRHRPFLFLVFHVLRLDLILTGRRSLVNPIHSGSALQIQAICGRISGRAPALAGMSERCYLSY